ncbi:MAG: WbqC family protein [Flavicella sp.]
MNQRSSVLLHPTYFSPIVQYAAILQFDEILFEMEDNFQKQTYRNRCYIYAANGKQMLNIPIVHQKSIGKVKTKDILIDHKTANWQSNHLKSFQAAYRSSPFYEFYEDDIASILNKKHKYLVDLNLELHEFVLESIQELKQHKKTDRYITKYEANDFRNLANAKTENNCIFPKYTQTFEEKHGFIKNLSILDLLCMEGSASYRYLSKIKLQ